MIADLPRGLDRLSLGLFWTLPWPPPPRLDLRSSQLVDPSSCNDSPPYGRIDYPQNIRPWHVPGQSKQDWQTSKMTRHSSAHQVFCTESYRSIWRASLQSCQRDCISVACSAPRWHRVDKWDPHCGESDLAQVVRSRIAKQWSTSQRGKRIAGDGSRLGHYFILKKRAPQRDNRRKGEKKALQRKKERRIRDKSQRFGCRAESRNAIPFAMILICSPLFSYLSYLLVFSVTTLDLGPSTIALFVERPMRDTLIIYGLWRRSIGIAEEPLLYNEAKEWVHSVDNDEEREIRPVSHTNKVARRPAQPL